MAKELRADETAVGEEVGEEAGEVELSLYKVKSTEQPGEAVAEFVQQLERLLEEPYTFYYEHGGFGCSWNTWCAIVMKRASEQARKKTGVRNPGLLVAGAAVLGAAVIAARGRG